MKIVLTGVTGFLGSHLAAELIQQGHEVLGIKRRHSNLYRLTEIKDRIKFIDVDDGLERELENHRDVELVIHTATAYGHDQASASDIVTANVVMPLRILECAVGIDNCAFINTDTFFCKANDDYAHLSCYIASKKIFLKLGAQLAEKYGVTFCNMRIEHMFGPCDGEQKFSTQIVRQLLADAPEIKLTPGGQVRDFVFVSDVVNAYVYVIDNIKNKSIREINYFEVGCGSPRTVMDFVTAAHRIACSKSKLIFGALPYRENEIMCSQANIEALQALGWSPKVKLEDGLNALVKSLR